MEVHVLYYIIYLTIISTQKAIIILAGLLSFYISLNVTTTGSVYPRNEID